MPVYQTPGVYFEKVDTNRGKITEIRTDIPGFVGITEKGPINKSMRLESMKQFQSVFGGFKPQSYLAYAINGFFENGGDTSFVTRIADPEKAEKAKTILLDINKNQTIHVSALNEGQWGNRIKVYLKEASMGSTVSAEPSKQPANKEYSIFQSTTGFEKGTIVKIFQNNNGTKIEDYHYVTSIEPLSKKIVWDSPLKAGLDLTKSIYFSTMEFTLTLSIGDSFKEIFENLSMNSTHSRYFAKEEKEDETVINGQSNLVTVKDLNSLSSIPDNLPDSQNIKKDFLYLKGGVDGISSIDIDDFVGDPSLREKKGLRCYEDIDEVSMICIPDIMIQPVKMNSAYEKPPEKEPDPCLPEKNDIEENVSLPYKPKQKIELPPRFSEEDIQIVQQRMIEHCVAMKDRIAILSSPFGADISNVQDWRRQFDSNYAALYYPWISVNDPLKLDNQIIRLIPPDGHVAGIYARSDLSVGVHKAPANEVITGAKDVDLMIENQVQDILNPMGINCLRVFPGRGVMVWGARTISSDKSWRFVNVRRLLMMIEESVEEATQWAVFEPNDFHLRTGIIVSVSGFLEELWRRGALSGDTPDEAFFVRCDDVNNPQEVIDAGRIIADVGVAPSIPAEFIVFRIGKVEDRIKLVEEKG